MDASQSDEARALGRLGWCEEHLRYRVTTRRKLLLRDGDLLCGLKERREALEGRGDLVFGHHRADLLALVLLKELNPVDGLVVVLAKHLPQGTSSENQGCMEAQGPEPDDQGMLRRTMVPGVDAEKEQSLQDTTAVATLFRGLSPALNSASHSRHLISSSLFCQGFFIFSASSRTIGLPSAVL